MTPIQIVANAYPNMVTKDVRKHLARCGISSKHAMQAIGTLSGGEQAKVKMCLLTLTPCNFLIMDEPTNHLDVQAKEALKTTLSTLRERYCSYRTRRPFTGIGLSGLSISRKINNRINITYKRSCPVNGERKNRNRAGCFCALNLHFYPAAVLKDIQGRRFLFSHRNDVLILTRTAALGGSRHEAH